MKSKEIEEISWKGTYGCLFAIFISFCRKSQLNYNWIVSTIGVEFKKFPYDESKNRSVYIAKNAIETIRKIIAYDTKQRNRYLDCIKKTIKEGNHKEPIYLISELFKYSDKIDDEIFSKLLSFIAERPYSLDWHISDQLSNYFLHLKEEQKDFILKEIKKIVSSLSARAEDSFAATKGMDELIFSLAVFLLQGDVDEESERVFLHGLQSIFIYHKEPIRTKHDESIHFHADEILKVIKPLLTQIPQHIIRKCIHKGVQSKIPEISSFCRVINSLTGN